MKKLALITTTALFSTGAFADAPSYTYVDVHYGATTIEDIPNYDNALEHDVDGTSPLDKDSFSDFDIESWELSGSFAVSDNFHVFGSYSAGTGSIYDVGRSDYGDAIPNPDFEEGGYVDGSYDSVKYEGDMEVDRFVFGLGYHGRFFSDNTTWHANLGYVAGTGEVKNKHKYDWMSKVAVLDDDGNISRDDNGDAIFEADESGDPVMQETTYGGSDSDEIDEDGLFYAVGLRSNVTENLELNGELGFYQFGSGTSEQVKIGAVYTFGNGIGVTANICAAEDAHTFGAGIRYTF